ncbi:MAG: DNA polymerase IV [Anaerolineales bacterium]|nr:DNA polymerase IV [Anaerolineales bacterium]
MDLDAFFCSVEELHQPDLKGTPFVVGGSPAGRGVVSSASYAARTFGIRSAMPTAQALRLCPDLIILSGRHKVYAEYSKRVMRFLRQSAPVVEQISIDEAFLDVSDDPKPGDIVAANLQKEIRVRFQLPTSWGVASNKLVAKIATEVGKPNGLIAVPSGMEAEFLAPLPVDMLPGVGPKTRDRLAVEGIHHIGELAAQSENRLREVLGDHGPELAARARGRDQRQVVEEHEPRSMSAETTFAQDVSDRDQLCRTLLRLSERVGSRLRKSDLAGKTIRIKLRWHDFKTITRQTRLPQPSDQDREIYQAALELFERAWRKNRPVRLVGVGVSDLGPPLRQLSLFDRAWEQDERLLRAIDSIRTRYGSKALRRAGSLRPKKSKSEIEHTREDEGLNKGDGE